MRSRPQRVLRGSAACSASPRCRPRHRATPPLEPVPFAQRSPPTELFLNIRAFAFGRASTKHWRSVQKLHSETALITPYNRAINIQASTWNAQAESRGHERRAIDLNDCRGIREMADLAPHRTAVDQYLRSIDVTSPLVRHVSQSPPL